MFFFPLTLIISKIPLICYLPLIFLLICHQSGGTSSAPTIVVNATAYDGCLERACVDMGLPCLSQSEKQPHFVTALKLTKNFLLEMWKSKEGAMADRLPRYKPEADLENMPADPAEPELRLCTIIDGCLCLPRDVRQEFLTDATRSPEWRKMLQEFDRVFGTHAEKEATTVADVAATQAFDWQKVFPGEITDKDPWHAEHDGKVKGKFQWCPELMAYLVECEADQSSGEAVQKKFRLYVEAMENYIIVATEPALTYGAGSWLLEGKAEQFMTDNPHGHKAVLCEFTCVEAPVLLEARCFNFLFFR